MRRFQYEQQQYQQQARDYERQQELRQKAVADAFAQLGKDAPNFTTRAEFEQRATLYSQQLQMMGIRVPPQALMQQVPYLEPSERDVIAEAINKNQKQFPDAWDGGAPLAAHIQYRDPKSGETRDIQIGKALEAGLVSLPVDPATGKWIGSEAKKPQDAPKIGTFEDYVTRAYGQNPTPSQIRAARREWAQSDNAPAAGPQVGSFEDYLRRAYGGNPTPEQIRLARREYMQADDKPVEPKEPNQGQFQTAEAAMRLEQAEPILSRLENEIASMGQISFSAQMLAPSAKLQSASMQSYAQAARNFINAKLRRESGAVISPTEFADAKQQYLPVPGDTAETLAQKKANRDLVFRNLKAASGNAYQPPPDNGVVDPAASAKAKLKNR